MTEALAFNIRMERLSRRWNQKNLGDLVGLSRSAISELEAGRRRVQTDELPLFCRALGINLTHLLYGAERADLEALGL